MLCFSFHVNKLEVEVKSEVQKWKEGRKKEERRKLEAAGVPAYPIPITLRLTPNPPRQP